MPLKKYLDYDGLDYLIQRIPRTKIKVTFDDVFAGETATCSMGTTTYTKTVPATEPYELVFPINELGTWSIATSYLGDDYGTTIEVTAIGQTATGHVSYETTPEGATVLPTDDIQTWLACANITDKSYTTLAEVLADRSTFETLIADSNACDYMARSTTWAVATGLVPNMTSATTPSGQVISDSDYSGQPNWQAFDGNDSTNWNSDKYNSSGDFYCGYIFTEEKTISQIRGILGKPSSATSVSGKFQYYDGINWVDIPNSSVTVSSTPQNYSLFLDTPITTDRIRLFGTASQTQRVVGIFELQFYEADIAHNQDAMSLIGKYDYCSNALLGNATWAEAIANSDYMFIEPLVPTMTDYTTPSGEVIYSSEYIVSGSIQRAYMAFDKNNSSTWSSAENTYPQHIGYKFDNPTFAIKLDFTRRNFSTYSGASFKIKIQGSVDGSTDWIDLTEEITQIACYTSNVVDTIVFTKNLGLYKGYRIYYISNTGTINNLNPTTAELQFYGRASAQTNIIHSAANDTIYMLENGSQVVLTTTNSDGDGILDFSQFMDGTYTLYSSVAKDPTNISNDYSKSIRITKTSYGCTTEAYLMPNGALYWYGFFSNNCGIVSSDNGWTFASNAGTWRAPVYNTNSVTIHGNHNQSTSNYEHCGISSLNKIDFSQYTTCKILCKNIENANPAWFSYGQKTDKNMPSVYGEWGNQVPQTTDALLSFNGSGEKYVGISTSHYSDGATIDFMVVE